MQHVQERYCNITVQLSRLSVFQNPVIRFVYAGRAGESYTSPRHRRSFRKVVGLFCRLAFVGSRWGLDDEVGEVEVKSVYKDAMRSDHDLELGRLTEQVDLKDQQ
jgi:hypothetical protein